MFPCSSDSFSFNSKRSAKNYHEQEGLAESNKIKNFSVIPSPGVRLLEMNNASDGFP
jgi:hypothetical protein